MNIDIHTKSELRAVMLQKRRKFMQGLDAAQRLSLEAAVAQNFFKDFKVASNAVIAGYWPLQDEFDCEALLNQLHDQGYSLCLPVVDPRADILQFRKWSPKVKLVKCIFGIMVPEDESELVEPDVVLVPFIAFDPQGHRLGYGRGYYDFTLEHIREKRKVLSIGLGYDIQKVDKIVAEPTDQPMDKVVTESNVFEFKVES